MFGSLFPSAFGESSRESKSWMGWAPQMTSNGLSIRCVDCTYLMSFAHEMMKNYLYWRDKTIQMVKCMVIFWVISLLCIVWVGMITGSCVTLVARRRWSDYHRKDVKQSLQMVGLTSLYGGLINLGGGFKHFLFSPRKLGKWSNLTNIFRWVETTN